jgi:hypothetical protein
MLCNPVKAIVAGAELLDDRCPEWYSRIHLPSLNMADPDECLLAQLYGDYCDGVNALSLAGDTDVHYGFFATPGSAEESDDQYAVLTRLWHELIQTRRRQAA